MGPRKSQNVKQTRLSRSEPGVSLQKCHYYSRGVAKIKNALPMLRMKHFFLLLLMQRGNHILPFLTPLCGVFDEKKTDRFAAEVLQKREMCFPCSV